MTLAVFVGNVVSVQILETMLRNQLVSLVEPEERIWGFDGARNLETLGFLVEMSPDEMMEAFDVSLDGQTIGIL